jgi:hypothetical protein
VSLVVSNGPVKIEQQPTACPHEKCTMSRIDLDELRERIRSMDFEPGAASQIAAWREDLKEARANLVIEDLTPTANEDEMFAVMLDEGVPPSLMTTIILSFYKPVGGVELEDTEGASKALTHGG